MSGQSFEIVVCRSTGPLDLTLLTRLLAASAVRQHVAAAATPGAAPLTEQSRACARLAHSGTNGSASATAPNADPTCQQRPL